LLADEPTGNLDSGYANDILSIFKSFNQVGVTLLIATHDNNVIQQFSGRTLALEHGSLTPESAAQAITDQGKLR